MAAFFCVLFPLCVDASLWVGSIERSQDFNYLHDCFSKKVMWFTGAGGYDGHVFVGWGDTIQLLHIGIRTD